MKKQYLFALLVIMALAAFFRFYLITEIPLGLYPDEAMNGSNAQEALHTGQFKLFYPENNGREGLFINIQALSVVAFGNTAWALRLVSSFFGTLTVLGIFLVARKLLNNTPAALAAAFFTAASYWHINFSRIGFRAIMLPFIASFGVYFLLKSLRERRLSDVILAGFFAGLGLYTYISYRFMPFVFMVPIAGALILWRRQKKLWGDKIEEKGLTHPCTPCAITLFLLIAFCVALPLGIYFATHINDFAGRTSQVSVFATASPVKELIKSAALTAQSFFWKGDCNWRHNYACAPQLYWPVAIFFALGLIAAVFDLFRRGEGHTHGRVASATLLSWLAFMAVPSALTWEGIPHALRSIGMIPPVMILAAFGLYRAWIVFRQWVERQITRYPEKTAQLTRIRKEMKFLIIIFLLFIPIHAYRTYFFRWAANPQTYGAFSTDIFHLAQFLNTLPPETKKYVIVNSPGTLVRGIPMPAQPVMFITDTFRDEERNKKNITYLLPEDAASRISVSAEPTVVAFLYADTGYAQYLAKKFPGLSLRIPGDFIILTNTNF